MAALIDTVSKPRPKHVRGSVNHGIVSAKFIGGVLNFHFGIGVRPEGPQMGA